MKRLLVNNVPAMPWMNDKAFEIVTEFNNSSSVLYLDIRNNYQNRTLDDILEEGMYDYSFNKNSDIAMALLELIEEAENFACFLYFDADDLQVVE